MDNWLPTLLPLALIPLVGFLVVMQWRRVVARMAARSTLCRELGFSKLFANLGPLRERVRSVQAGCAVVYHNRPTQTGGKRRRVERAREKLIRLGFFQPHPGPDASQPKVH